MTNEELQDALAQECAAHAETKRVLRELAVQVKAYGLVGLVEKHLTEHLPAVYPEGHKARPLRKAIEAAEQEVKTNEKTTSPRG
mgnify:CR=1 FL=1